MVDNPSRIDPKLAESWLRARSKARNLPQPVPDHGGLRVDTASESELVRYVFAAPVDGLRQLGIKLDRPRIFLKLCGAPEELQALLPSRWALQPVGYMMINTASTFRAEGIPNGFIVDVEASDVRTFARVLTKDGRLAASGYATEFDGVFVYDRILTEAPFRRMGLGSALMAALRSARRSSASTEVLVATAEGRALYTTLGWRVSSLYSTATLLE